MRGDIMQQSKSDQPSGFKKDYYGGALMVLIGLAAFHAAQSYHIGSLSQMGPGFFPAALGVLMACMGVLIAISARRAKPAKGGGDAHFHPTTLPDGRAAFCIIFSVFAFIIIGSYGGLIPATFAITFISALGDRTNTVLQALLLALVMCLVAVGVFWWALQLQLPLFQWSSR
jgi:hypothetical protein